MTSAVEAWERDPSLLERAVHLTPFGRAGLEYRPRTLPGNAPSWLAWVISSAIAVYSAFHVRESIPLLIWGPLIGFYLLVQIPGAALIFLGASSAQKYVEDRVTVAAQDAVANRSSSD